MRGNTKIKMLSKIHRKSSTISMCITLLAMLFFVLISISSKKVSLNKFFIDATSTKKLVNDFPNYVCLKNKKIYLRF